jgi:bla regulator protein blaR1
MIAPLTNHLWQSTLVAAGAWLLSAMLRNNRAGVRHGLWLAASLKFLIPFSLLIALGSTVSVVPPVRVGPPPALPALSLAMEPFAAEAAAPGPAVTSATSAPPRWLSVLAVSAWAAGVVLLVLVRLRSWRRIRAAVAASSPVETAEDCRIEIRSSPGLLEPGVVGIWRPVMLLPADIAGRLTPAQLAAVIAHEICHVRRRDNLTASMHMAVETIFWFHPAVWWIGRRLLNERERACDEAVLDLGTEPREYAQGIVNVCRAYVESPLACVSGVSGHASQLSRVGGGSNLAARIEAIMTNRIGPELTSARRIILVLSVVVAIVIPITAGTLKPGPIQIASTTQKFEVASIRPCAPEPPVPGARSGGGNGSFSPGRAYLSCFVVKNLIDTAYVGNRQSRHPEDALDNWPGLLGRGLEGGPQRIRGGPAWVYSDKYSIEAKAEGLDPSQPRNADRGVMLGPMLRTLLEERFQLKVHEELEEVPMLALTIAKGGLKIKPMPDGGCTTDRSNGPILLTDAARRGVKPTCGTVNAGPNGPNWRYEHGGQKLAVVAAMLSSDLGIKVVDRTGITDTFNFSWEYGPDENTPGSVRWLADHPPDAAGPPTAPSVFTALQQQLGLTLEKITGSRGYLVIDRIARPTADGPLVSANPPARARGARGTGGRP